MSLVGKMDWREAAACRDMDTDLFFPETLPSMKSAQGGYGEQVQRVCQSCPVRSECLEWALEFEHHGWWGGTSPEQRRQIRRQRDINCLDPKNFSHPRYGKHGER